MAMPYIPTAFSVPVVNPSVGSQGANPLPYISPAEYQFVPTAMAISTLVPGKTTGSQLAALADVIRRASRWADNICFGADPDGKASLAASLSVESDYVRLTNGDLRLVCDYRPIRELVGLDVGWAPTSLSTVTSTAVAKVSFGRRVITVPYQTGYLSRSGTPGAMSPYGGRPQRLFAVWSYVNGYPHTKLLTAVTEGSTSCKVMATNGRGGLWGVYAATGAFAGSQLLVVDGAKTEAVAVKGIETGTSSTTLTTSPFLYAHTVPESPTFLPVTGLPEDIHQAVITLATMLIKTSRGSRTLEMPKGPGQQPNRQVMAQAGATGNWTNAQNLLHAYRTRVKRAGAS